MRFVAGRGAVADRLVRGTVVADRLVRGTALAELLLAREPPAQRTAGRGAAAEQGRCRAFAARNRHCCGARAPTIRRHRRGARAANKAQAPLRGKGAGRKQELARGVRS